MDHLSAFVASAENPPPAMPETLATNLPLLAFLFFGASMLYASVGHGGASAYLAVMGIIGMAPQEMKPIALSLNIAVSAVALFSFVRAGHFDLALFRPLALVSIPAAFLGGWIQSPEPVFKLILAVALIVGAWRLLVAPTECGELKRKPAIGVLLAIGGAIGFLSGLVGIGGGIFLTPVLVIFRMAPAKVAAAVSAAFIAVNSISGISGFLLRGGELPAAIWPLLPCVLIGALIGSLWGSGRARIPALRRSLAAVLIFAAAKFLII
ncbi:MAG: sulfite exporter TauE/SafE family protein [Luteolibacter sp.]